MRQARRTRIVAIAILTALAGSLSVGVAALARAGVCVHRLGWFGLSPRPDAMPMDGMAGMTMPAGAMASGAPCPILTSAALAAGVLYVVALGALAMLRPSARELALASARLVLGVRFGRLTLLLALIGAVPLAAAIAMDGDLGGAILPLAAIFLIAAAALAAYALAAAAGLVLVLAKRLVLALVAALRLLAPSAGAPWLAGRTPVRVSAGAALARRRPSRAPPAGRQVV